MAKYIFPSIAIAVLAVNLWLVSALAAPITSKQQDKQNHTGMNHSNMNHGQMETHKKENVVSGNVDILPKEPGQGAFATIAEIVAMLINDPMTDWSKVNIDGLREHLIDMDELSLRASSKSSVFDNKIVFNVTGSGRTLQAIQAMIPAHAAVLSRTTAWNVKGELTDVGANLTVSSDNPATIKVVKALGFYGVMAIGAHHQAHHLAMAKGDDNVHAHN